jgi:serine/threonine protein kinase
MSGGGEAGVSDTPLDYSDLEIGREIGRGAFSRVYVGSYKGHAVAIKKMSLQGKDAEKYLMTELGILKSTHHENLIKYHGAAFRRPEIFIVTEFMNGGSKLRP